MGAEQSTPGEFFTGEQICEDWSRWMRGISDSTSLKDMSIPGTHNSMAFYGGPLVRCQSMSLWNQYVAGIRFVDIRCRHYNNELPIHHGEVYQHANLDDVLRQTSEFLRSHPTETVIMSVREEYESANNSRPYEDTLKQYLLKYPDLFFIGGYIPNLGRVRGKIVIMRRFPGSIGIHFDSQNVKDDWNVPTILPDAINRKLDGIKSNIAAAKKDRNRNSFYITFCSGSSGGAYPDAVADRINIHVKRYAEASKGSCLGIVIFDFPGSWVSHAVFMTNSGAAP